MAIGISEVFQTVVVPSMDHTFLYWGQKRITVITITEKAITV